GAITATAKNGTTGTSTFAIAANTPSSSRSELIASHACKTSACRLRSLAGSMPFDVFASLFAEFLVVIIGSIDKHASNVNSQEPVNIASHHISIHNLKPFVCNNRKVVRRWHSSCRASDVQTMWTPGFDCHYHRTRRCKLS